jgi:hypothetical protein
MRRTLSGLRIGSLSATDAIRVCVTENPEEIPLPFDHIVFTGSHLVTVAVEGFAAFHSLA